MYYVIEVQTAATGAALPFTFTDRNEAEAKYHELLSVAAKSSVPKHGAMLFTDDLFVLKQEVYVHATEVEAEA